jgi:HPt (histidine-containing phosphotransfer) domain-containing protein
MGCNNSNEEKEKNKEQSQGLKDSLATFPTPAQAKVGQNAKDILQLEEWPMALYKQTQPSAADVHSLAQVAKASVNKLLQSSVLTVKAERRAIKAIRDRLDDEDESKSWEALQALVDLIEELCKTYPQIQEYVQTSEFKTTRPDGFQHQDFEATPSFENSHPSTPRSFQPDTPRSPQAAFLETPRIALSTERSGQSDTICMLETPRMGTLDTPRFGSGKDALLAELDPFLDEFFAEPDQPCPTVASVVRFASAPPGFNSRRRQTDGCLIFTMKPKPDKRRGN